MNDEAGLALVLGDAAATGRPESADPDVAPPARRDGPGHRAKDRDRDRDRDQAKGPARADQQAAAGDVVPLSFRVSALSVLRIVSGVVLTAVAVLGGRLTDPGQLTLPGTYVLAAVLFSSLVIYLRNRRLALFGFGIVLCADVAAVQTAAYWLGPSNNPAVLHTLFLSAVCLLASFRTGIKLTIWASLLIVLTDRAGATGLLSSEAQRTPVEVATQLVLTWVAVLVVCAAAAINERELRRRRYDAEALQAFAAGLHRDDTPDLVLERTIRFVVDELDASRAVLCAVDQDNLRVLRAHPSGPVDPSPGQAASSPLLELADTPGRTARVYQLDPVRDRWLAAQLPGARRLIVMPLGETETGSVWAVFEHRGNGSRVERRVVAAAGQASATAALALSRVVLFGMTRRSAVTDPLTGLANRRAYDEQLDRLARTGLFAVLLVDIDFFKSVNDKYGHQVGDQVLQAVAGQLARTAPPGSTAARYGGEEFAVLLPGTGQAPEQLLRAAAATAEQLRRAVATIDDPAPITASLGVAVMEPGQSISELVAAADEALYRAKAGGRNRVVLAS